MGFERWRFEDEVDRGSEWRLSAGPLVLFLYTHKALAEWSVHVHVGRHALHLFATPGELPHRWIVTHG